MTTIVHRLHESPIGPLRLAASEYGLRAVFMQDQRHVADEPDPTWREAAREHRPQWSVLESASAQLDEYFDGRRDTFDLPLDLVGTAFQRSVWEGLRGIPFGATISYAELARRIGNPKAVRAVGLANGRNPVSIVVPCHRVIGADGSMTGYGGGIERKVFLLELERKGLGVASQAAFELA